MTMILIGLGAGGCSLSRSDGGACRDFLASYVKGRAESWLQGAACKAATAAGKFIRSGPGNGARLPKIVRFDVDRAVAKMQLTPQMKAKRAKCPKSEPFSVK